MQTKLEDLQRLGCNFRVEVHFMKTKVMIMITTLPPIPLYYNNRQKLVNNMLNKERLTFECLSQYGETQKCFDEPSLKYSTPIYI